MYWDWTVRRGRNYGRQLSSDYIEIHYEDLVSDPRRTLSKLGEFIEHELDYDHIQKSGLGRIRESNSSFREEPKEAQGNPVNRWKEKLTAEQIAGLEAVIGDALQEFGYELTTTERDRHPSFKDRWMRSFYPMLLDTKLFLKNKTPLGRFSDLSTLELDAND